MHRSGGELGGTFDVAIIGGGINGCGIARDAAGRGLSVYLCEQADLASGTSSASTKLIHGGLRYLEYYEFRLVRESLQEREVLWRVAPHIVSPLRFVLPHHKGLRPAWLLRLGLFLYDHLGGRKLLPATRTLDLRSDAGRQAAQAGRFHQGVRVFRLLGRRCAAGGAERGRRRAPRRRHPHPHPRGLRRAAGRPLDPDHRACRERPARADRGPHAGQRRRSLGRAHLVRRRQDRNQGAHPPGAGLAHRGAEAVRP